MTLTSEEMRLIREALKISKDTAGFSIVEHGMLDKLLRCDFPHIPDAVKVLPISKPLNDTQFEYLNDGNADAYLKQHNDGYIVFTRRRAPYNFRPVEWFGLHELAKLFVEQLQRDAQLRGEAIRDAKGADFYLEKSKRAPRQKREKIEAPDELFDLNGNPLKQE
jgi:hypothetical protein